MATGKQVARIGEVPAPIRGWNSRDPLSAMDPQDAVILENFIPTTGGVDMRHGWSEWCTGLGDSVETLMEYHSTAGVSTLFGAAGTSIYDVTSEGVVGAAVVTSTGNARWQHTMFSTTGGDFLVCANGAASVRNYDGSSWTTPSITGVTSADLISVTAHANRLWFIEKDTLDMWYLPTSSISGAATKYPLGSISKIGGELVALASWTRDGGSGSDDVLVCITSRGEVMLFSGTDPSSINTWQLVGTFRIPEPIGYRCVVKAGADVAIITSQGVLPMSTVLPAPESSKQQGAYTDRIKGAFNRAYTVGRSLYGWQLIEYPRGGIAIVNVPIASGEQFEQFVMNSLTGAWCKFDGIDAVCWSLSGDDLYFGDHEGNVCKYGTQFQDGDDPIEGLMLPAFSHFGVNVNKRFTMARPILQAADGSVVPVVVKVDYDTSETPTAIVDVPAGGSAWDVSPWDTSPWGPGIITMRKWQSLSGVGTVGSVMLNVSTRNQIRVNHIDILFEPGGPW